VQNQDSQSGRGLARSKTLARQPMRLEAPKAIFVAQTRGNAQGSSLGKRNTSQWA